MDKQSYLSVEEWGPEPELQNSSLPRKVAKRYPLPLFLRIFLYLLLMTLILLVNLPVIKQVYITRFGKSITGTVQEKKMDRVWHKTAGNRRMGGYGNNMGRYSYEYRLNIAYPIPGGQEKTDNFSTSIWEYNRVAVGGPVALIAHPDNPLDVRLASVRGQGEIFIFFEILLFFLVAYAVGFMLEKLNLQRQLVASGRAVPGLVKEIREDNAIVKLVIDYKFGDTDFRDRVQALMYNGMDYRKGEYVTLLVNPINPEQFLVYHSCGYKALAVQ